MLLLAHKNFSANTHLFGIGSQFLHAIFGGRENELMA